MLADHLLQTNSLLGYPDWLSDSFEGNALSEDQWGVEDFLFAVCRSAAVRTAVAIRGLKQLCRCTALSWRAAFGSPRQRMRGTLVLLDNE